MAAEEDDHDGSRRHGSLAARKIRGRPRHGTELGSRNRRENAERSPRPGPARQPDPLPDQARHAPLLRANPYSEVTDPICRLPLPTLVYRLEALHLETCCGYGYEPARHLHVALSWIFKVRGEDPDTAATAVLFAFQTLSPC
ncbi:hypothetical protein P5V15_003002 [Pogonomyrmex californicus]